MPDQRGLLTRLIQLYAVKEGMADPALAVAVATQESNLNPKAVGDGGKSLGLFQLQRAAAIDAGIDPNQRGDLRENIRGGVRYLKMQLEREGGQVERALSRYNRGTPTYQGIGDPRYVEHVFQHYKGTKPRRSLLAWAGQALTPSTAEAAPASAQPVDDGARAQWQDRLREIEAVKAKAVEPEPPPTGPQASGKRFGFGRTVFQGDTAAQHAAQMRMFEEGERKRLELERKATWSDVARVARPVAAAGTSALGTTAGAGVGATIGAVVGGPPGMAVGGLIGGMAGSYIARRSNVELGLEEPGRFGDVASIVAPAIPGLVTAGRQAVGALARGSRAGQAVQQADEATEAAQAAYEAERAQVIARTRAREAERLAGVQARRQVAVERHQAREAERLAQTQRREAEAIAEAQALTAQQQADYQAQLQRYNQTVERQRTATQRVREMPRQFRPEVPSRRLYDEVTTLAPEAPVTLTRTQEVASSLALTYQQAPTLLPPRLHNLLGDMEHGRTTQTLQQVRQYLTDLGALTRSPTVGTRQTATQLYGALHDDLEASALRLPETDRARQLLLEANKVFRREQAVGELSRILRQGITVGDDGLPRVAVGRLLTRIDRLTATPIEELTPRERLFVRSFEDADWQTVRQTLGDLVGVERIPARPVAPTPAAPRSVEPFAPRPFQEPTIPATRRVRPQTQVEPQPGAGRPEPVVPALPPREQTAFRQVLRGAGVTELVLSAGFGPLSKIALLAEGKDALAEAMARILLRPEWTPYLRQIMRPDGQINVGAMVALAGGRAALAGEKSDKPRRTPRPRWETGGQ